MSIAANKTHVWSTLFLLAVAALPSGQFFTLGAYGDTEASVGNVMQASKDFTPRSLFVLELDQPGPESVVFAAAPQENAPIEGEVAGTSTDPVLEVSEPVIEITSPEPEVLTEPVEGSMEEQEGDTQPAPESPSEPPPETSAVQ